MSEKQEKLLAMMERKKSLSSEALGYFRKQIFQEIRESEEKAFQFADQKTHKRI